MMDFETWLHDSGEDKVFRMLIYRRPGQMYTPYEIERKFTDQNSVYEDTHYSFVKIKEAIELPDRDILLGLSELYYDCSEGHDKFSEDGVMLYKKLSEIELSFFKRDMDAEE